MIGCSRAGFTIPPPRLNRPAPAELLGGFEVSCHCVLAGKPLLLIIFIPCNTPQYRYVLSPFSIPEMMSTIWCNTTDGFQGFLCVYKCAVLGIGPPCALVLMLLFAENRLRIQWRGRIRIPSVGRTTMLDRRECS